MSKLDTLNKLAYILLPTFIICVPVILFNTYIQTGYPPQFPYSFEYWGIIEPFYKTFSHGSKSHYTGNILTLFSFSVITGFFVRFRYHALFYVLITIYSASIIEFYINGIGTSIIGYGIVGLLSAGILILMLKSTYYNLTENRNKGTGFEDNIAVFLVVVIFASWILMNMPVTLEIIYIFNSIDLITNPLINPPSSFSIYSSIGHSLGYAFGLIYGINSYLIKRNMYRFNFDSNI